MNVEKLYDEFKQKLIRHGDFRPGKAADCAKMYSTLSPMAAEFLASCMFGHALNLIELQHQEILRLREVITKV